jgi:hypothetical protein
MSDSLPSVTLSLDALLELAVHASWACPDEDVQIRFLQWMANELQYQYGIDRSDLTRAGFPEDTQDKESEEKEDEKDEDSSQ